MKSSNVCANKSTDRKAKNNLENDQTLYSILSLNLWPCYSQCKIKTNLCTKSIKHTKMSTALLVWLNFLQI